MLRHAAPWCRMSCVIPCLSYFTISCCNMSCFVITLCHVVFIMSRHVNECHTGMSCQFILCPCCVFLVKYHKTSWLWCPTNPVSWVLCAVSCIMSFVLPFVTWIILHANVMPCVILCYVMLSAVELYLLDSCHVKTCHFMWYGVEWRF